MTVTKSQTERPRRGRPPIISDEALLEAAREVFLARGIRATTAEVAERAKISEGTIFHRYKTKDALFGAAMNFDPDDINRMADALMPTAEEIAGDLRTTLVRFALRFLAFNRTAMPMMMMSWSNPASAHALGSNRSPESFFARKAVAKDRRLRSMKALFDAAIARGELGEVNSTMLSRMYLGTLRDYSMSEVLGDASTRETERRAPQKFVEELVDLILRTAG